MSDSRIIGDLIGDDLGDLVGDDGLGDLIGDGEIGRRRRQRRVQRVAARHGMVAMPREQAAQVASAARAQMLQATNAQATADMEPLTAGHYVADPGQRELYLPFAAPSVIAAAAGSAGTLNVVVQRPMQIRRIILAAIDNTTLADVLPTLGVTNVSIGVDPIFNAQGVAPATAFEARAVGVRLCTGVARVGTTVTVQLSRVVAGANPCTVTGYMVGVSAVQ